jgi:hypothetical protein
MCHSTKEMRQASLDMRQSVLMSQRESKASLLVRTQQALD